MMVKFLNAILPTANHYVTAYRKEDGGLGQVVSNSIEELAEKASKANYFQSDCWLAVAGYEQGWYSVMTHRGEVKRLRTRENVSAVKALWLDIDIGEGKPYATREEAVGKLRAFIQAVNLPRPYIVASGAKGLHCYWAFEQQVSVAEWDTLAHALKNACNKLDLKCDHARTTDVASLMRMPNTYNKKTNPPARTDILLEGAVTPFETLKELLAPHMTSETTQHKKTNPAANNAPALHMWEGENTYPKRDAMEVIRACKQIQNMDSAKEPAWRAALSVLRHCERGVAAAKVLSKSDKWHSEYNVDDKLAQLEQYNVKPTTCEVFAQLRPEACEGCPLRGLIRSPISAPAPRVAPHTPATTSPAVLEGAPSTAKTTPETSAMDVPDIDTGLFRVNASGCWVKARNDDGEVYWRQFYEYPVYPIQRVRDKDNTGALFVSYVFRKHRINGYDDVQITGETLMGTGLSGFLGSVGFLLVKKERDTMANMLINLLKHQEHALEETKIANNLGWDDEMQSFLLGDKIYRKDGKVIEVAPKGRASTYSSFTKPRGSLEKWKQIADVYNRDGLEWGQAALATAFASPLMPIGALEKSALLFITGAKGVGKSTALNLAVSVFGDPTRMMINKDDTFGARLAKLGIMHNISAAFDEMTDLRPDEASALAYQITQGRGKDRLVQTGETLQHNTTYWSCLPVMSANDSIISHLSNHSIDATAQMSRVLEIRATDFNSVYSGDEVDNCQMLVRDLPQNFGTAGDVYMRYVVTHVEEIKKLVYGMEKLFVKTTGLNSNYRFWTYMCARMLAGVTIAQRLGLVNYNVAKLFNYLVKCVNSAKRDVERHAGGSDNSLAEFLNAHTPNRLVVRSASRPVDTVDNPERGELNDANYVVQTPAHNKDIAVRLELDTGRCAISVSAIKAWCKKTGMSYAEFIKFTKSRYTVPSERSRVELGRGTVYRGSDKIDCVVVNLPSDLLFFKETT